MILFTAAPEVRTLRRAQLLQGPAAGGGLSENTLDEATLKTMKLVVEEDKYAITVGKSL